MHKGNGAYGHREVLCRAAYSPERSIHAYVQHGWTARRAFELGSPRRWGRAPILGWSAAGNERSESAGLKLDAAIGSPYLYFREQGLPDVTTIPDALGTLVIPPHSTRKTTIEFNHHAYISKLKGYVPPGKVVVMFHPDDFVDKSLVALYTSQLEATVWSNSAQMQSTKFLSNLHAVLTGSTKVIASALQTAVLYAAFEHIPVVLVPEAASVRYTSGEVIPDRTASVLDIYRPSTAEDWYEMACLELGLADKRPAADLRDLFGFNDARRRAVAEVVGSGTRVRGRVLRAPAGAAIRRAAVARRHRSTRK